MEQELEALGAEAGAALDMTKATAGVDPKELCKIYRDKVRPILAALAAILDKFPKTKPIAVAIRFALDLLDRLCPA